MFSCVHSAAIAGVDAVPVTVEADLSTGLPGFVMVGYLSSQVREAQDRVRTALRNTGYMMPAKKATINLSPSDLRKEGPGFDLPIAIAVLAAMSIIPPQAADDCLIVGGLSLSGAVEPVNGVLAAAMLTKGLGLKRCIVPEKNVNEGGLVEGIETIGLPDLAAAVRYFATGKGGVISCPVYPGPPVHEAEDFSDIHGQTVLKRAALIAAAGFHNLLMSGPPGAGKSMTARRIPSILPELTREEALEVTRIHSIAGLLPEGSGILRERPFRAPHHTATPNALAGGGRIPRPGEVTLAHRGVLFLDEMPEFSRASLETLRMPLEDRKIVITRASGTFTFPASFLLAAAMNPCPCGYYPDLSKCSCTPQILRQYRSRISRPLLDRIDLCVQVPPADYEMISIKKPDPVSSAVMREQAGRALRMQEERFRGSAIRFNSLIPPAKIPQYCPMSRDAEKLLARSFAKLGLTARTYHRLTKTARTAADLSGEEIIREEHIREALFYRMREEEPV